MVAIAVDRGLSLGVAAGVLAAQQGVGVIARGAVPVVAERWGCRTVWVVGMALQSFPLLLLFFSHDAWAFYLFAIPFGIGQSCEVPTFPIANRQYYGNVPQGSLYGWQNLGNGLGMGLAPVCAGLLWDLTGTYMAPLIMSLGFSLMALFHAWLLPSPRARTDSRLGKPPASQPQAHRLAQGICLPGDKRRFPRLPLIVSVSDTYCRDSAPITPRQLQ